MDDIIDITSAHARRFWRKFEDFLRALDDLSALYTDNPEGLEQVHFRTVVDFNTVCGRCFEALNLFEGEIFIIGYNIPEVPTGGTSIMNINIPTDRMALYFSEKCLYRAMMEFHTRYHPRTLQPGYPSSNCYFCNPESEPREQISLFIRPDLVRLREYMFMFVHIASSISRM